MNKIKYYTYRIKWRLLMPLLRAKSFNSKNSIFIFSEPRGGSTWLMEILSKLPETATIFEPFHSHYGALDSYTWGNHYYKEESWPLGKQGINNILNANKFDSYQLERSSWSNLISANQFIFKCVMATPILPWIVENFDLNFKPIYILRHPLSVASSTLDNLYKRDKKINVDHKWEPSGSNKELYDKHKDLFSDETPMIDKLIARWCINNHYALQQNGRWISIYYEDMLLSPEETLTNIFDHWSIPIPQNILTNLDKPSHSDFKKDFRKNKEDQLSKWINKYSFEELEHFQDILDRFDIKMYSSNDPLPKKNVSLKE